MKVRHLKHRLAHRQSRWCVGQTKVYSQIGLGVAEQIVPIEPVALHTLLMTSDLGNIYRNTVYPTQADINLQAAKDAILGVGPPIDLMVSEDDMRRAREFAGFAPSCPRPSMQDMLDGEAEDRYIAVLDHRHERGG